MVTKATEPITADETLGDERLFFTPAEVWDRFDAQARLTVGHGGEEFLRRWEAGEYDHLFDEPGHWRLTSLMMKAPSVREIIG